jgi:hypothetical protein
VQLAPEHPQHGHLLAAVMRRVRQSPRHHPGLRALHVEEGGQRLPPCVVGVSQPFQPPAAVLGIPLDELESSLRIRERWRADIDAEHGAKPGVFADALMDHLLVNAAAPRIILPRPDREILVSELAPYAEDLQPFGLIGVDQKVVSHGSVGDGHDMCLP